MKKLPIGSGHFQLMEASFKEWLKALGYSRSAVTYYPLHLRELFHFLEGIQVLHIKEITPVHLLHFSERVRQRRNEKFGGGLSAEHINHILQAVGKFLEYLRLTKDIVIHVELLREENDVQVRDVLTVEEVTALFETASSSLNPIIARRDVGILAVLYGAALRKNELVMLDLEDVSLEKRTIHVRHGKGSRERIIPVTEKIFSHIAAYITGCRDLFCDIAKRNDPALFIDVQGRRMSQDSYYKIIRTIVQSSPLESIHSKRVTLHTFRHSIATHLLLAGMDIEVIARFLGHSSLDSTMIYTHLAQELKQKM